MRILGICAFVAIVGLGAVTRARFAVDGKESATSIAVAAIEPRAGAPGYSWLRVYFYASGLGSDDSAAATQGRIGAIKAKWSAVLQLTMDKDSRVWQVDLALPGHTCTVAESDRDAKTALPESQFGGKRLRLRGKGSHVCDMASLGVPNQTFTWDVDLDVPVVASAR